MKYGRPNIPLTPLALRVIHETLKAIDNGGIEKDSMLYDMLLMTRHAMLQDGIIMPEAVDLEVVYPDYIGSKPVKIPEVKKLT